jgi:hypothetical protein
MSSYPFESLVLFAFGLASPLLAQQQARSPLP